LTVLVTDGQLPYPYGRELTGYDVADLTETLAKAKAARVRVLVEPYTVHGRNATMVEFAGGYIAEIHAPAREYGLKHHDWGARSDGRARSPLSFSHRSSPRKNSADKFS
jgi:hypothetical protein